MDDEFVGFPPAKHRHHAAIKINLDTYDNIVGNKKRSKTHGGGGELAGNVFLVHNDNYSSILGG